jgi:hypothetical protein
MPAVNEFFLFISAGSFILLAAAMAYASMVAGGDDKK